MRKIYISGLFVLAAVIIGFAWAEQITLTTYYPAPYGVYREFTTTGNTYLATDSGNVGIGMVNPTTKLEVQGGAIKATDGLIIETRTQDPESPQTGQIWLRTDITPQ